MKRTFIALSVFLIVSSLSLPIAAWADTQKDWNNWWGARGNELNSFFFRGGAVSDIRNASVNMQRAIGNFGSKINNGFAYNRTVAAQSSSSKAVVLPAKSYTGSGQATRGTTRGTTYYSAPTTSPNVKTSSTAGYQQTILEVKTAFKKNEKYTQKSIGSNIQNTADKLNYNPGAGAGSKYEPAKINTQGR